jgi:nitroreductase
VFLTEVLYEKANMPSHRFAYVDAGMNAFPRPAIYGAEHQTACANKFNSDLIPYRVFGPVCESGDVLARDAMLPRLNEGDCVVFFEAGAYCRSMASHYNQRTIPAELFCRNGEVEEYTPSIDPTAFLMPGSLPSNFNEVVESRRSVRRFSPEVRIPESVMNVALEHALLAPNSSNLQMWEFIWVRSAAKRKKLVEACLSQPAAATAAELVICVARMDTWQANRQRMLDAFSQNKSLPEPARRYYEKIIPLALNQGPFGLFGLAKRLLVTVGGWFRAVPRQPTSHSDMRVWAVKSTALACENLMLSLRAQGFDTCPMEGFDSKRVKKLSNLKGSRAEIVMVLGVGAALPEGIFGERLRFDSKHYIRHI